MKNRIAVGIDLGTSTSVICAFQDGEPFPISDPSTKIPIIPSIVAMNRKGQVVVGDPARSFLDAIREIKRKMGTEEMVELGGKQYRPEEISALILRKLKENAEAALGYNIQEVVLSVPANFDDAAKTATLTAGELAGLKITRLINEPTAAALAFGIKNIGSEEQLVIFDFGGGTLDITVLEMFNGVLDVKCSFGDPYLGGKDFDEALIELVSKKFNAEYPGIQVDVSALKEVAEKAKKNLSTVDSTDVRISNFAVKDGIPINLEVEVTRQEFEKAIEHLLERARNCVRQALNGKKIRPSAIDRVLLVGGTTYIPAVRRLVMEVFGKEPKADVNPDLAVSIGTSVQAALEQGLLEGDKAIILLDVAPIGLGIDIYSDVGGQHVLTYEALIQPNEKIPYSFKKTYTLVHAEQREVEICLYQDKTGKAQLPSDAVNTGIVGKIIDIPPSPTGIPYPLEIEFSYDINGIARLTANIPAISRSVEIAYDKSAKRMDEIDKSVAAKRLANLWQEGANFWKQSPDLWKQSARANEYEPIINKAERKLTEVSSEQRTSLSQEITRLKQALESNNSEEIQEAGDKLTDLLFDLDD
ncbi:Hsp70 family protein [Nostoc sp. UHCC 0702]|nr:Hsp70 family protein [Nostoc sp. UHCC 0702]